MTLFVCIRGLAFLDSFDSLNICGEQKKESDPELICIVRLQGLQQFLPAEKSVALITLLSYAINSTYHTI